MEINVLFFGVIAEITGMPRKVYFGIRSFDDLKHRLEDDFPEIVHYNFRYAVNSEIVSNNCDLKTGDEVACLPPFAGG